MNRTKRNTRIDVQKLRTLAIERVEAARNALVKGTEVARTRGARAMNRLEKAFEQRVSKTVSRLGIPSHKEVRALSRQVAELRTSVEKLRRARA